MKSFAFMLLGTIVLFTPLSARAADPGDVEDTETPVVFNGRSFPMFPVKIQPVLMNLCARCHCRVEHESAFKLRRVREGYADPQSAGRNARTVVRFLSAENPGASVFLQKAVTAHGGAKDPPLNSRNHPAFKNLEYWAYWAMSPEGSPVAVVPRPQPSAPPTIRTASATQPAEPRLPPVDAQATDPAEPQRLPPVSASTVSTASTAPVPLPATSPQSPGDTPTQKRNPDDLFDPAEFNNQGR
ncbi:MAG: hypothetical protein LC104_16860 [Bacteroidales bacterium]|nr:hypothetical protein [Bacteroidales bacterium]